MKNSKLKQIIIALGIPLLTGGIASLLTKNDMKAFKNIAQPPLSPPQWLFPVVWSILYSMMGYASYLVYKENDSPSDVKKALALYCIQLIFNFGWTIIFFHFDTYYFAFAWLVVLWGLIIATIKAFYNVNKTSAYLLIPYLLWVTFAGYLNLGVAVLNN